MNVSRIQLTNFRSWASVELDVPAGVTLLAGPNGAGKSSLIEAVLFAMFGASSSAEAFIRRGTDTATVVVEISGEAGDLQITRTIRRTGNRASVSLDLRQHVDGSLYPLSGATVTETQAIIDDLLGVSREVLLASAFSTQHGGGAFTEAAPRDRKRVFAEILALGFWDELADQARVEKRVADDAASIARAELDRLDGATHRYLEANGALSRAQSALDAASEAVYLADEEATRLAAEAEDAREARHQRAAAVEAEARASADHLRAGVERAAADEALATAKAAAANAPSVEDADQAYSVAVEARDEAQLIYTRELDRLRDYSDRLRMAQDELTKAQTTRQRAAEKVAGIEQRYGVPTLMGATTEIPCPECGKALDQPGDEAVIERAREAHRSALAEVTAAEHPIGQWAATLNTLQGETMHDVDAVEGAALGAANEAASLARQRLVEAETIQSLAGSIDTAQQRARDAFDRQNETAEHLRAATASLTASPDAPMGDDPAYFVATQVLDKARRAHSAAATELARAEEAAKLAERQAAEETAARERLEVATREAAVASILTAGFGPQGCPALIVDSVLGDLADEANRVLSELASPIRVDLRSQRLTQKGDLVDTLEIVVTLDAMEAAYETLSGGERTRVALALRAALTRLLASKRGARVRLLVVDEPAGIDSTGAEHLAAVLNEFVTAGVFDTVLLVTHHDALADQIDRVVRIEKSPGGESRLIGAATPVPISEEVAS